MLWKTLGESATGTSHVAREQPCQDAFRVVTLGETGEWLVIAVSDGAGSASLSEIGSTIVCDELVKNVAQIAEFDRCNPESVASLFAEVRQKLLLEAESRDIAPRELACTALLAVVGPTQALFAQLGDGAIVHRTSDVLQVVFWPEPAEYANATDFLTDDSYQNHLQMQVVDAAVGEISAFTDGLQRLALNYGERTPYAGFFAPLFRDLSQVQDVDTLRPPLREFLESDRVNKRTDDDKTLVLAVRQ
jgi:serine/threonine protein phosphatase PrpC